MSRKGSRNTTPPLWLFGYGSLIWRPDFPFVESAPASVRGWSRRFWQGSHDHRGTPDAPGRVVTLIREAQALCGGVAFRVDPARQDQVMLDLDHREKNGYERQSLTLELGNRRVPGITYIATPGNFAYMGPEPIEHLAVRIAHSVGPSGRNSDYLFELAQALRGLGEADAHVFELEAAVRHILESGTESCTQEDTR